MNQKGFGLESKWIQGPSLSRVGDFGLTLDGSKHAGENGPSPIYYTTANEVDSWAVWGGF